MEIRIGTKQLLTLLKVLAWIIFIGLCIQAGGIIVNFIATLALGAGSAARFWKEIDLSALYQTNRDHFITLSSIIIIATVLKALMFYFIVRILHDKRLDLPRPFNETLRWFIMIIAYIAGGIGLFSLWGSRFADRLKADGIALPDAQQLQIGGADVWLFMGVILIVIASIFRKGIEIQTENDLTV